MSNSVSPREAQRLVRSVIRNHNLLYPLNEIRSRVREGNLEISVKGKARNWFALTCTAQVQAFSDGVGDAESEMLDSLTFNSVEEQDAYDFGRREGSPA